MLKFREFLFHYYHEHQNKIIAVVKIFLCIYQYSLERVRVRFFENYRARIFIFQRTPAQNGSLVCARELKLHTPAYAGVIFSAFAAPSRRRNGLLALNIFTIIPMDSTLVSNMHLT